MFSGIQTFMGYLMPKPSLLKDNCDTIKHKAERISGFMPFPKSKPMTSETKSEKFY